MRELICKFGAKKHLFGILTQPDADDRIESAPIAIVINAGIVHRIGPFRMNVDVARQLASVGFSTLRMDLSGLGDSGVRTGKMAAENRAELDVQDAIDYLQATTGVEKFVIVGLCSGAYNAHCIAVKDERIVGGVFMDGIVFPTVGYYFRHYIGRLFRFRFWRNAFKRRWYAKLRRQRADEGDGSALAETEFFTNEFSRQQVSTDLRDMLQRGVQMLFLYTDGWDDICGRRQFKEMYRLSPGTERLQVEYYPKSEHTFRLTENRCVTVSRIACWFQDRFQTQPQAN